MRQIPAQNFNEKCKDTAFTQNSRKWIEMFTKSCKKKEKKGKGELDTTLTEILFHYGYFVDLPTVSGLIINSIRFWNVLIYWFVSLKSLKALYRAALCDTNRSNLCTRDYFSRRTCADVWPLHSSNRIPILASILIRWLGVSPRSSTKRPSREYQRRDLREWWKSSLP